MEVRFRGSGLTPRQMLSYDGNGVTGRVVVPGSWLAVKLHSFRVELEEVRSLCVRQVWNIPAGVFLLVAVFGWGVMGWVVATWPDGDVGYARLLLLVVWLIMFFVVVELWTATVQVWLEIDQGWGKVIQISVALWSKKQVEEWAAAVDDALRLT